ncbi:ABC transporter A like protein [Aduncisulcus paluster]|uniref:ABC transporter A like protein n=1 Tax=Aduncisulcus paluster TaxID=2918883 RepID=A0ABQ5KXX9_9EUKA|nr:ABC transporter A like protein [Aduncisulcus paluster]
MTLTALFSREDAFSIASVFILLIIPLLYIIPLTIDTGSVDKKVNNVFFAILIILVPGFGAQHVITLLESPEYGQPIVPGGSPLMPPIWTGIVGVGWQFVFLCVLALVGDNSWKTSTNNPIPVKLSLMSMFAPTYVTLGGHKHHHQKKPSVGTGSGTGSGTLPGSGDAEIEIEDSSLQAGLMQGVVDNKVLRLENITKIYDSRSENCCKKKKAEEDAGTSGKNSCLKKKKPAAEKDGEKEGDEEKKEKREREKAVNSLSLSLSNGMIVSLLGHNGSGKSTTVKMMMGDESITDGSCSLFNTNPRDLICCSNFTRDGRIPVSVCPQVDPLHPDTRVKHIIHLICQLKATLCGHYHYTSLSSSSSPSPSVCQAPGADGSIVGERILSSSSSSSLSSSTPVRLTSKMLEEASEALERQCLDLVSECGLTNEDIETKKFKELSGGMKRKLTLCLTLIGSPRIMFLDECSSGVDISSQREMWALIQSKRADSLIILTTHSMEEADALGDVIIVLAKGELSAAGTPVWLKNTFSAGFCMDITPIGASSSSSPSSPLGSPRMLSTLYSDVIDALRAGLEGLPWSPDVSRLRKDVVPTASTPIGLEEKEKGEGEEEEEEVRREQTEVLPGLIVKIEKEKVRVTMSLSISNNVPDIIEILEKMEREKKCGAAKFLTASLESVFLALAGLEDDAEDIHVDEDVVKISEDRIEEGIVQ